MPQTVKIRCPNCKEITYTELDENQKQNVEYIKFQCKEYQCAKKELPPVKGWKLVW